MDTKKLSKSAQTVQDALLEKGIHCTVIELPASTRTAQDAATTLGCQIAQIAKSLIFKTKESNKPVLILASGANRVNEQLIEKELGEKIIKADADFIREVTGFAIGGIPPIGHKQPNAVFNLKSKDLQMLTQGVIIAVH